MPRILTEKSRLQRLEHFADRRGERLDGRRQRARIANAGRRRVAAAAELFGDLADVEAGAAAEADLRLLRAELEEQQRRPRRRPRPAAD